MTAFLLLAAALPSARQQTPTFRAGADIVTIDATVLDEQGRPMLGLGAGDFLVTVDGKSRRVVSATFVSTQPVERVAPVTAPGPSSNRDRPLGRSFMFLIDTDEIRLGDGQVAMAKIATFVDRLGPNDRVGLVSLPTGTPRIDLTDDRVVVRAALGRIVGASTRMRDCAPTMGELAGITLGDDDAAAAYAARAESLRCASSPVTLSTAQYRMQTRTRLDTATALATAMGPLDGQKTLIFVAQGGLLVDTDLHGDLDRFGRLLERAHVSFYAVQLSAPLADIGVLANTMTTGRLDERFGFEGLADAVLAGGGRALKSAGDPTLALDQIDREVSGYYLLAVERGADDKENDRLRLNVRVNRPGTDVRVRQFVTIEAEATARPAAPPGDARAALGALLRTKVPAADLGIEFDAFSSPSVEMGGKADVILAAELTGRGRPMQAIGYEIVNEAGKGVEDDFVTRPATMALSADRYGYFVRLKLAAGRYRIRLGAIDDAGARGSLEHGFVVGSASVGDVRVGDVIVGDDSSGAFRPATRVSPGLRRLVVRVDLEAPASAFADVTARFRVRPIGDGVPTGQEAPLALRDGGRPTRHLVATAIDVANMASGPYEAIVTVVTPKGQTTVSRRFTVPATAR